jgi:subtilisin family serine protease
MRTAVVFPRAFALALFAVVSLTLAAGSKAPAQVAGLRRRHFVQSEALVCFKPEVSPARAEAVLKRHRVSVLKRFTNRHLYHVKLARGQDTVLGIRDIAREPDAAFCQHNFIYHAFERIPNDTYFEYLWGLHNTGQENGTPDADIDAPEAWDLSTGSPDVVVGIVDTGVDYGHPDLAGNIWTNPDEIAGNGRDDDGNGYVDDIHGWDAVDEDGDPMDENGHGTHVAGTIGATGNNSRGVVGVNWRVSIIATRFLDAEGSGTTVDAIECLDYLNTLKARGVALIASNNSWGGGGSDPALRDSIAQANNLGMLFCAAAGNESRNNDTTNSFPANYDLPNVISVAATDRNDRLADFSNYGGSKVDLGAPGVEILSTVPRFIDQETPYRFLSGTSMATPHVTGAAALLKARVPSLGHLALRDRLLATGDPISALSGKTITGRRLNVFNALNNGIPEPPDGPELLVDLRVGESYPFRYSIPLRVKVKDSITGAPVSDAAVSITVQTANGTVYNAEGTTGSTGKVVFRFRPRRTDGSGTYLVTVSASKDGYSQGSDNASFEVF